MHNGNTREEEKEKETEETFKATVTVNFPQISVRHQARDQGAQRAANRIHAEAMMPKRLIQKLRISEIQNP